MNKMRIHRIVVSIKKRIKVAWPPTLVLVTLLLSSYFFFGKGNMVVGPFMTLTFLKIRNNDFRIGFLLKNILIFIVITLLAFISMKSLPLCLISNGFAILWISTTLINPFEPKNYIPYGLALVSFQISPVSIDGLPMRLLAVLFSAMVIYIAALLIYKRRPLTKLSELSNEGLINSAALFESLSSGDLELIKDSKNDLFETTTNLGMEIYSNNYSSFLNYGSSAYYYKLIMSFGDIYNLSHPLWFTKMEINKDEEEYLLNIGAILRGAANARIPKEKYKMALYLSELVDKVPFKNEQLNKHVKLILNSLVDCLFNITRARWKSRKPTAKRWNRPSLSNLIEIKIRRLNTDSFLIRFSLRLLIIILPAFAFAWLSGNSYSYWLPLSLFLLVLPLYDNSFKHARSRVIGTTAGLLASFLVFLMFPSEISHYFVAVIAYFFIYFSSLYTIQVIFITIVVVSLNQISETIEILGVRLAYTFIAAVAAMFANRFFFPTRTSDEINTTLSRLILVDYEIVMEVLNTKSDNEDSFLIRELKLRSYLVSFKLQDHLSSIKHTELAIEIEKLMKLNNHFVTGITHVYTVIRKTNLSNLYIGEMNKHIKNICRCLDYMGNHMKGKRDQGDSFFKVSVYKNGYNTILNSVPYLNTHLYICEKYAYGMLDIIEKIDIIMAEGNKM